MPFIVYKNVWRENGLVAVECRQILKNLEIERDITEAVDTFRRFDVNAVGGRYELSNGREITKQNLHIPDRLFVTDSEELIVH